MGLINCNIHGENGVIPYISNDLCQIISSNKKISPSQIKSIHAVFFDEGEILFDRYYFFSATLFHQLSLKENYEIISDEDELNFNNLIKKHLGVICIVCFKDYMESINYEYKL